MKIIRYGLLIQSLRYSHMGWEKQRKEEYRMAERQSDERMQEERVEDGGVEGVGRYEWVKGRGVGCDTGCIGQGNHPSSLNFTLFGWASLLVYEY